MEATIYASLIPVHLRLREEVQEERSFRPEGQ